MTIENMTKKLAYIDLEIELIKVQIDGEIIPDLVFDIIKELKAKLEAE